MSRGVSRIDKAVGPPGAQKLLEHIRAKHKTVPAFCEFTGLDRLRIQKLLKGQLKRIDVTLATEIQKATRGAVKIQDWSEVA